MLAPPWPSKRITGWPLIRSPPPFAMAGSLLAVPSNVPGFALLTQVDTVEPSARASGCQSPSTSPASYQPSRPLDTGSA